MDFQNRLSRLLWSFVGFFFAGLGIYSLWLARSTPPGMELSIELAHAIDYLWFVSIAPIIALIVLGCYLFYEALRE